MIDVRRPPSQSWDWRDHGSLTVTAAPRWPVACDETRGRDRNGPARRAPARRGPDLLVARFAPAADHHGDADAARPPARSRAVARRHGPQCRGGAAAGPARPRRAARPDAAALGG